jgi:hypothetical protein
MACQPDGGGPAEFAQSDDGAFHNLILIR